MQVACAEGEGPHRRLGTIRWVGGSQGQLTITGERSASAIKPLCTAKPAYTYAISIRLKWIVVKEWQPRVRAHYAISIRLKWDRGQSVAMLESVLSNS